MKSKPSRNFQVGHLNLIHGSIKIRYVGLNWSSMDLFMYLIVGIGFGTWKYWHLNWALAKRVYLNGHTAGFCPCNQKWETSGRSRGWVQGSGPSLSDLMLVWAVIFLTKQCSMPLVAGVHRLRNTWSSQWEVICLKKSSAVLSKPKRFKMRKRQDVVET